MGIFQRLTGRRRPEPIRSPDGPTPMRLQLEHGEFQFTADDGTELTGRGFNFLDPNGRSLRHDDEDLAVAGIRVVGIVGESYRMQALQSDAFLPGQRLALQPEPDNPHDGNAVGVWSQDGALQAGYLPRAIAAEIAAEIAAGGLEAMSFYEVCRADGQRCSLKILVAPAIGPLQATPQDGEE